MSELIYPHESYEIVGACIEVHRRMGSGFLESVYQECLEIELRHRGIRFKSQLELQLTYRDQSLKSSFKPDFVCYEKVILEIKALANVNDEHRAQVINYLNATKMQLALLVNFGAHPKLTHERFAFTN